MGYPQSFRNLKASTPASTSKYMVFWVNTHGPSLQPKEPESFVKGSVLEAVNLRAASASALPFPPKRSYFISSYPPHVFGSGCKKQPLPLPLPKH